MVQLLTGNCAAGMMSSEGPNPAVKPLIDDTQERKDSLHLYYRKP